VSTPRPRVEELRGDGESIALRSTNSDDSWLIQLGPDGFRWERAGADEAVEASVGVAAPADALTLLLYGRSAPPRDRRYEVVGDEKVLARWLECSAL